MKICFLADAGGVNLATHLRKWAHFFADKGHTIYIISWNEDLQLLESHTNINLIVLKKLTTNTSLVSRFVNYIFLYPQIKKIIKEIEPDILHAHSSGSYAWMGAAVKFKPYFVTPYGTDITSDIDNSKLVKFLTTYALKSADCITTDADHMKHRIISLGVDPNKIHIIYFGIDTKKFSSDSSVKKREAIISTRTLTPVHDVETLVQAIPSVLEKVDTAEFVIVGDGCEREKLEKLAAEKGVSSKVSFVGLVDETKMIELLRNALIYVSTSLSDAGIAASTAEAMACGLPVIITDNGNNADWIENGESGFLVPNGGYKILAEKIIHLLCNENDRGKFSAKSRHIIETKNNIEVEMLKVEELYKTSLLR